MAAGASSAGRVVWLVVKRLFTCFPASQTKGTMKPYESSYTAHSVFPPCLASRHLGLLPGLRFLGPSGPWTRAVVQPMAAPGQTLALRHPRRAGSTAIALRRV